MSTTETNKAIVTKISADYVTVAINGETKTLTWSDLDKAATYSPHDWTGQNDKELADFYAGIRDQARVMAAKIRTVKIKVGTSTGGATWEAQVYTLAGVPAMQNDRTLSEPHKHLAESNAKSLRESLTKQGYTIIG